MNRAKRIIITGIPGTGTKEFCNNYVAATSERLRVKIYNMGDMLLDAAQGTPQKPPIPPENLLNLHPEILNALRNRVFDIVLSDIRANEHLFDRFIIDMHAQFFWNNIYTNAFNWRHLEEIEADMFFTLIEKPSTIKERQMQTTQGRSQDHDLRDLLLWQNIGVNVTSGWSANYGKPFYVLPSQQDPLTIESLLQNAFLIYFQMPMTDASSEANEMITAFKQNLLDLGRQLTGLPTPLIDPRTIDIETGNGLSEKENRTIRIHTVHRDMNWYINKASDLVAFYPPRTMLSKGVGDETVRGFETGKNAFVVYSGERVSPFMNISTHVFTSEKEFFNFFPEYMKQRIEALKRVQ